MRLVTSVAFDQLDTPGSEAALGRQRPDRAGNKEHALPPLWEEAQRVDDAIGPPIVAFLKGAHHHFHGAAAVEVEHERYVFEDDPGYGALIEEPENLSDQAGAQAVDASGLAGLTKVLAGKATDQELDFLRKVLELTDIGMVGCATHARGEDGLGWLPALAGEDRLVPRATESFFEAAHPREETHGLHIQRILTVTGIVRALVLVPEKAVAN